MKVVVADTSPINYLVLVGHIDLLPALYGQVLIPSEVRNEMLRPRAPEAVRAWAQQPPEWLMVKDAPRVVASFPPGLGLGEQGAILLAQSLQADLLLVDDGKARAEARRRDLPSTGVLGILSEAHLQGLIDFPMVFSKLQQTSFRYSEQMVADLLKDLET